MRSAEALQQDLSNLPGMTRFSLMPISFDNKTYCKPTPDPNGDYAKAEAAFMSELIRAVSGGEDVEVQGPSHTAWPCVGIWRHRSAIHDGS